jgi:hypothetical protein
VRDRPTDFHSHTGCSLTGRGSTGITPLHRYYGRSDSHRAALRASIGHEHRSGPSGSPCLAPLHVPPFRLQPPRPPAPAFAPVHASVCWWPQARKPCPQAEGTSPTWVMARAWVPMQNTFCLGALRHSPGRLASRRGRIGFRVCPVSHVTLLRTGRSPPAALHLVLPRRSSLRLQAGERSA